MAYATFVLTEHVFSFFHCEVFLSRKRCIHWFIHIFTPSYLPRSQTCWISIFPTVDWDWPDEMQGKPSLGCIAPNQLPWKTQSWWARQVSQWERGMLFVLKRWEDKMLESGEDPVVGEGPKYGKFWVLRYANICVMWPLAQCGFRFEA